MIDLIKKIEEKKKHVIKFTQDTRNIMNNFCTKIVDSKTDFLPEIKDPPYLMQSTVESYPTIMISAEESNLSCITDVNLPITKLFYLKKS